MEELFVTHGDENPSGENLEYSPEFVALKLAAETSEERQMGDSVVAAVDFNARDVQEKALVVLSMSHDLKAAALLARAQLQLSGFPGFAEVLRYVRFCLEDHWQTCHPELDEDDDDDPTMRVNAVLDLADRETMLPGVRTAPLTKSPTFGMISVRDLLIAEGELPPPDDAEAESSSSIDAAFKDTDPETLVEIYSGVQEALSEIKAINAVFDEKTPGRGPDLDELTKLLQRAAARLAEDVDQEDENVGAEETADSGSGGDGVQQPQPQKTPGEIGSAADAEKAIDAIIRYYEKNEPSSPLPIVLNRAKKLLGADFLTIVNDLAPDGIDNVRLVGGIEEEE